MIFIHFLLQIKSIDFYIILILSRINVWPNLNLGYVHEFWPWHTYRTFWNSLCVFIIIMKLVIFYLYVVQLYKMLCIVIYLFWVIYCIIYIRSTMNILLVWRRRRGVWIYWKLRSDFWSRKNINLITLIFSIYYRIFQVNRTSTITKCLYYCD